MTGPSITVRLAGAVGDNTGIWEDENGKTCLIAVVSRDGETFFETIAVPRDAIGFVPAEGSAKYLVLSEGVEELRTGVAALEAQEVTDEPIVIEGTLSTGSGEARYALLPCPFCGAKPVFLDEGGRYNIEHQPEDTSWDIACRTPNCFLEHGAGYWSTKTEIVAMWNKRPGGPG